MLQELGFDVWTEAGQSPWVDVRVPDTKRALLDLTGLEYTVRVPDLGPLVDAERVRVSGPVTHGGAPPEAFFADYAPLAEIEAHLDALVVLRPDLVSPLEAGESVEGRTLRGLSITSAPADAPALLLDAGQHAREWIAVAATTCVADRMVRDADTARVASVLQTLRIVVVPVVNPDGYVHTWEADRFWRKNRRAPEGVDLNRNFGVAWGGPGASASSSAGNYHGEGPFSEPESAGMRDLAQSLDPLLALVDVHAYGQLVLYPWGFELDPAPADDVLAPAAQAMADGLFAPWATEYLAIPGAALYPAAGNIMDWAYGDLGAYAYGIELRPGPDAKAPEGFVLPPQDIIPVCDELFEGVLGLAEHISESLPPGSGDDGASAGDSSGEPTDGSTSTGEASGSSGVADAGTGSGTSSSTGAASPPDDDPTPGGSSGEAPQSEGENATADGCGCASHERGPATLLWPLLLVLVRRRNRQA